MLIPFTSAAQGTTARDKFFTYFSDTYAELSKPPLINYFVNLNNSVDLSFSRENPFFLPALAETVARYKITEDAAADTLYQYSLQKLLDEKLWIQYGDIYKDYSVAFKAYNDALCPCVTANFKSTDNIDRLMPVLQRCVAGFSSDTVAQKNIRLLAGDISLNEIFRKQQYFSLYTYQNCGVVGSTLNQTLRREAYSNYLAVRAREKGTRASNVLSYYRDKKTDSLAAIFPAWKKFTKELNEALAVYKTGGAQTSAYSLSSDGERKTVVSIFTNEADLGNIVATFSSDNISAPVAKVVFNKPESLAAPVTEIKEDAAVPVKQ